MKKLRVIAIIILLVILSMQTAWASGEYIHTSKGIYYKEPYDLLWNFTSVGISIDAFPNIIAQDMPKLHETPKYTVYGNSINNDTLTIGEIFDWNGLSSVVYNHIKYIESIGGVMTGYAEQSNGYYEGYVISWDVGERHHYAKFCKSNAIYPVGYYDLEFYDGSNSEKYIPQLNATLKLIIGEA